MLKEKCRQATRLLSEQQDRPLALGEQIPLGLHLLACPYCRNFKMQLRFLREASQRCAGGSGHKVP
ncbi:zf-HC2 domain-containing protein [Hylemonella gracilis]|jgi:hypothetical protein|uniref:Zf-HC2 domain-containing protein n=1 Tax=Hylemonella gracilis TaxID=80880 RepID=A0A4P6UMG0_9BURK|nr:zf-HC2 domain-containing protein [Hylemonella gracilis]QBK04711.1 zf-HC2 domain-containing protein [Hylemonella gracilis]